MAVDVLRILALSTLASSAAIFLILLLRKPLRQRFGAQAGYALWALVPASALVALLPAPVAPDVPLMTFAGVAPDAAKTIPLAVAVTPSIDPMTWLGVVWLLGIIVCAALFLRQQRRFVRALGSLSPDTDRTFRAQATAGCPALVGAWRPRIVLPADFDRRYDRAERELILAHEHAHRTRGDAQVNALVAALRCLYWFNPLFQLVASRFRFDQELACDAIVISRFPEARRPYADAMLKTQLADLGLPAGCHWQSSHPLKERIAMLKQPLPGRARRLFGRACVAAIVAATSFAVWAAQPGQEHASNRANSSEASFDMSAGMIESVFAMTIDGVRVLDMADMNRDAGKHSSSPHWNAEFEGSSGAVVQIRDGRWSLVNRAGKPWSARAKRGGEIWEVKGTPQTRDDGKLALKVVVEHYGKIVSTPNLIVQDGEPAAVQIGSSVEVKDGDLTSARGLKFDFTLHKVTDADVRAWHKNSDAAGALPPPDAGNAPQNIGISYRRISRIEYPQSAIAAKAEGVVYIAVHVTADGRVADAKVSSAMPMAKTDITDAALAAIKTWTFNPRLVDGKPVVSDTIVPVAFSLDPDKPVKAEADPNLLDTIGVSPPQGGR